MLRTYTDLCSTGKYKHKTLYAPSGGKEEILNQIKILKGTLTTSNAGEYKMAAIVPFPVFTFGNHISC